MTAGVGTKSEWREEEVSPAIVAGGVSMGRGGRKEVPFNGPGWAL